MAEAVPSHGLRIILAERVTPGALGEAIREFFRISGASKDCPKT